MVAAPRVVRESSFPIIRTPLVGRSREIDAARRILLRPDVSILTLTGPPGIGKTRLALHVASDLQSRFNDGIYFVPLASLSDPSLVPAAIAHALGFLDEGGQAGFERLLADLHQARVLLVLDNFEHLLPAAPIVANLLTSFPSLQVLATSRTPLRISGEFDYAVSPLEPPDLERLPPLDQLAQNDAVALFVQRATAASAAFSLSHDNAADVAEICVRLDGLPLAIELAAARTRLLPPAWLRARVVHWLHWLTEGPRDHPPRLQSIRDAIDWSHTLLTQPEQQLFRQLSVFAGGFTLDAVEAVGGDGFALGGDAALRGSRSCGPQGEQDEGEGEAAQTTSSSVLIPLSEATPPKGAQRPSPPEAQRADSPSVLDLLASLVDASLVQSVHGTDGQTRYAMLETIREYAGEKLTEAEEAQPFQDGHAQYVLQLAEMAETSLRNAGREERFDRLEVELANLRSALAWLTERNDARALRLAVALFGFWLARGWHSEGRDKLGALLAQFADDPALPPALLARAFAAMATLSAARDDYPASEHWYRQALSHFTRLDDRIGIAGAKLGIAEATFVSGDWESANALTEESLALSRQASDMPGAAQALEFLGMLAQERDDYERSTACFQEALAICQSLGDQAISAAILTLLGLAAQFQGELERAAEMVTESLAYARTSKDSHRTAERLGRLASIALDAANPKLALSLALEGALLIDSSPRDISPWAQVVVLHNLGAALRRSGEPQRARATHDTALGKLRDLGSPAGWTASVLVEQAADLREIGEIDQALDVGAAGLALAWQAGDYRGTAVALEELAQTALRRDASASAVRLAALAARIRQEHRIPLPPGNQPDVTRTLKRSREALGSSAFAREMRIAGEQPLAAAIIQAHHHILGLVSRMADAPGDPLRRTDARAFELTPREQNILRLMVQGLSNPDIAASLGISPRTVRTHVTNILSKLGVGTRTAAATFALRHGLIRDVQPSAGTSVLDE